MKDTFLLLFLVIKIQLSVETAFQSKMTLKLPVMYDYIALSVVKIILLNMKTLYS